MNKLDNMIRHYESEAKEAGDIMRECLDIAEHYRLKRREARKMVDGLRGQKELGEKG